MTSCPKRYGRFMLFLGLLLCVYEACIRALACLSLCVHFWPYILAFWWRWHDNNGKSTRLTHTTDRKWKTTKLCLDGRRKVLIVASFREIGIINALLTDLNVAYIIWTFSVDDELNHLLQTWNVLNESSVFFGFWFWQMIWANDIVF